MTEIERTNCGVKAERLAFATRPTIGGALPPVGEMMHVDPKVLAIVDKTVEELAAMGLAEFADEKGIVWNVSTDEDGQKGLAIRIGTGPDAAPPPTE